MSTDSQTVSRIEQLSLSAWPALRTVFFDGWIMRFSDGYTKRSNSVVPLFPGTMDTESKVDYCRRLYNERNLPTIFKMTEDFSNATLDAYLSGNGFDRIDETMVQTCPLSSLPHVDTQRLHLQNGFSEEWITGFFECSEVRDPKKRETVRSLLAHIAERIVTARKCVEEHTVGCGFGVVQGRNAGLFDIFVAKDFRQRGIATEIVGALLKRAGDMGAASAYLQVVADNEPAKRLYSKLGFREAYRYWYRIKPADAELGSEVPPDPEASYGGSQKA